MVKQIIFHKGVMLACMPIAGVGGVIGAEPAKKAWHQAVAKVRPSHRTAAVEPKFTPFVEKQVITESCMLPVSTAPILLAALGREAVLGPTSDIPSTGRLVYPGTSYPGIIGGSIPGTPGGGGNPPPTTNPNPPPTTNPTPPPPTSVVPEPKTWAMMGMGFGVLGVALRVRRRYDKQEPSV